MPGPKMPKSPSELFGTDRRSPNHSAQAVHPDSLRALGAHTGRSRHIGFWRGHRPPATMEVSQPLRTPSAAPALGWAPWVWVRPPMHTDLQRKQDRPFRAPRANFPCRIALYPGGRLSGPHLDDC